MQIASCNTEAENPRYQDKRELWLEYQIAKLGWMIPHPSTYLYHPTPQNQKKMPLLVKLTDSDDLLYMK